MEKELTMYEKIQKATVDSFPYKDHILAIELLFIKEQIILLQALWNNMENKSMATGFLEVILKLEKKIIELDKKIEH